MHTQVSNILQGLESKMRTRIEFLKPSEKGEISKRKVKFYKNLEA
jgi:hypothetical protein